MGGPVRNFGTLAAVLTGEGGCISLARVGFDAMYLSGLSPNA